VRQDAISPLTGFSSAPYPAITREGARTLAIPGGTTEKGFLLPQLKEGR
jgi:hypothetical protein